MNNDLDFEKPLVELRTKVAELKKLMSETGVNLTDEIVSFEQRMLRLEKEIFNNLTPWQRVAISRHPKRPTTLDFIPLLFENFMELHGDRVFGDDKAIVGGIAKFQGKPVTVIGQQRGRNTKENLLRNFGMPYPEGYRKALRLMKQAEKFRRPIITFIDTKGAFPGVDAEERGQSQAIAENIYEMSNLKVPIICIVIGEGASGGALGIGVGNHIHMLENTWFSVIAPESASNILWRDSSKGKLAADLMKITAPDLKELGIIDELIPEVRGGAHNNHEEQAVILKSFLAKSLSELSVHSVGKLVQQRINKFRTIGKFGL
ncbi:acetyl-CoA carboxylase carboxyltransferase subunit alpha [Niallia taxi]|uniref:acetyl-CoA carboxylase carboxyltransferase subunit alpha n=1 Tax=Niallia taxi TaxID=2499688 RepID=UPI002E20F430|nr:acetyl-CoA carboxylase carboxyltransferase subunit alpha [Niallia taxi]MED4057746.1 acetyl-CoA carboxylase carboxyltransferase subunit alpha [Niallia taxi]MED4122282.1 acetyl-CoA carboxylase carboxyltransferase subunit alpha [Niallia taxi]